MTREQILQAVRAWLKTTHTLTDALVRVARTTGAAPVQGFVVDVGQTRGLTTPATATTDANGLATRTTQLREVVITVRGIGDAYAELIESMEADWRDPWSPAGVTLRAAGLTPQASPVTRDLSPFSFGGRRRVGEIDLVATHRVNRTRTVAAVDEVTVSAGTSPDVGDISVTVAKP